MGKVKMVALDDPETVHCHSDFGPAFANSLAAVKPSAEDYRFHVDV